MRILPLLFASTTALFVAVFMLSVAQPWYSARFYMKVADRNYLTIDNRSAFWTVCVGDVGGVSEFDAGFEGTDPIIQAMRAQTIPETLDCRLVV